MIMINNIKKQLVDSIYGLSLNVDEQIEEYHKTKGGASVTELMETWFDYMPDKLSWLKKEGAVNGNEEKLFQEFHDFIDAIVDKIPKNPNDEEVFRNNPNWVRLREKAKEVYNKLSN